MKSASAALAGLLLASITAPSPTAAQPPAAPYEAIVRRGKIDVFSGPGGQYYRTSILTKGEAVEVHHKVGGYLGIRPPEGSFSWAPGSDIKEIDPGVAAVQREGVPSRVGSLLTEERNVVHVRLKQGERVRVLSRVMIDGSEWAQIAPPAGEFRWVRAQDVGDGDEPVLPDRTASIVTDPVPPPATLPPAAAAHVPASITPAVTNDDEAHATAGDGWVTSTSHDSPAPALAVTAPAATPPTNPHAAPPTNATAIAGGRPLTPPAATTPASYAAGAFPGVAPAPSPRSPAGFNQRLALVEVELSRRVSQASSFWRLDDLQLEASRLLAGATNPEEQAAARSFALRVGRFGQLARRGQQLTQVAPATTPARLSSTTVSPLASPPAAPQLGTARVGTGRLGTGPMTVSRDVTGELRSVVSKRPDAPKFALVDNTGRVTTFLTPQPGMDLQPLLGKQVIVTGVQGVLPSINQRHVAASRVAQAPPPTTLR
ncbi:MAG: hypothetical protein AAGB00_04360 [Planctomycetota bacterium]